MCGPVICSVFPDLLVARVLYGKGPFNSPLSLKGLVHSFGPHPPTQPLMDHLTLKLKLGPAPNELSY